MAVDEAILIHHSKGDVPPTIRFYGWDPPAVSTGYFQDLQREIDLDACRRLGVGWVRRVTGGRAILHDQEVTYSVVASEDEFLVSGSVLQSYLKISRCLLEGLRILGINATMSTGRKSDHSSAACFDAPSRYELVVDNRKLIGSAQTRKYGCILQHGSIPIHLNVDKLFSVLKFTNEKLRERLQRDFARKAISLSEAGGRSYGYGEVVRALSRGFAGTFKIVLEEGTLTEEEEETARILMRDKYGTEKWNFDRKSS
ncbi:MAG: lipoate--protein ligase family protein [Peptococcaceae bacterium]|nr:lipoate--protein ligase family protein [Peptococcaceae bacterium]